jgi:hypothetical protein
LSLLSFVVSTFLRFCTDKVTFWNDDVAGKKYSCADAGLLPGEEFDWCLADDPNCTLKNKYQDCVRGPNACETNEALGAVANYVSELAALDAMGVERLAIGVGKKSNVEKGSALWMIDNNPGKMMGILPLKVMSTDELSSAVSNLCILNTDPPTGEPSASPSTSPTVSPAPSIPPTSVPSSSPSTSPTAYKTGGPTAAPVTAAPSSSPSSTPTSSPTASPTATPSISPSASPTVSPAPTHELPDCYDGTKLIKKDSSDVAMCAFNDDMVEIVSMDSETVSIKINDVWTASGDTPDIIKIFEHSGGADELIGGDGFSCSNPDGTDIALDGGDSADIKCYASIGNDGSVTMLAVIDLMIVDPVISDTNSVVPPCGSMTEIDAACIWRLVIPCAQESMCTDEPSSSPSSPPTSSPSASPSAAPSSSPSSSPTVYEEPVDDIDETEDDTDPIVPVGPEECPEDEVLVVHEGVTSIPPSAVTIISQDTTTVTIQLSQQWTSKTVDFVYYQYAVDSFNNKCYAEDQVDNTWSETITIQCSHHSQVGQLQIWLKDSGTDVLVEDDNAVIPKCCYPEETDSAVVSYILEISCVPKCPTIY